MSICPSFSTFIVAISVAIAGVYFAFNDSAIAPEAYHLPSPPKLTGPLAPNTRLRNAQYLLHGVIQGPESLHFEGDSLYTGIADGRIVKIDNGMISKEYRLVPQKRVECDGSFDAEPVCGRPLGIRKFDADNLLVADAYFGLYLFNMETGESKHILDDKVAGNKCTFFNDVEVLDKDNVIYSCSSLKWQRRHAFQALFEQRSDSTIMKYTISSKKLQVLAEGLKFANGVQLTKDKSAVIFSETGMARIWKLSLKEAKAKPQLLLQNLPGFPDNIRQTERGTFLTGLASHRSEGSLSLVDKMAPIPFIRKFLLTILPNVAFTKVIPDVMPGYGFVIEFDQSGRILESFQDPEGRSIKYVSEAVEHNGFIYLGSFRAPFLAKTSKKGF